MTQNFVNSIFSTLWRNEKQFENAEKKFSTLQPEDHVSFFYQMLKKKKLLPTIEKCYKSTAEATRLKKLGDEAFYKNCNILAVQFYTKSAAIALPNSEELASAYRNRSAALFRLESYTSCMRDIQRALSNNCDQKLKEQLEKRKLNCVLKLTLKRAMKRLGPVQLVNSDHSEEINEDVEIPEKKEIPTISSEDMNSDNSVIPNASNKIKMTYNPKYGRHIIATKEIKPGEILCVEKPYASVLSLNLAYSHCANCYLRCDSLIACPSCCLVMFCTKTCQESAYNRFHRVECEIIGHAHHFGIKDKFWLAIRMLMVATNQGAEIDSLMNDAIFKHPMRKVTDVLPCKDSTYANIHNLEDHVEKRRFDYPNGIMAALLLHILKESSFFGPKKNNDDSDSMKKETFVGILLLKFIMAIECNAIKHFETVNPVKKDISIFLKKQTGLSIYPYHCYFNHSCDENTSQDFHYDFVITRAMQLIYPGQQIYINYYGSFNNYRREIREKYLNAQYYFRCTCRACEEDWPQLENAESVLPRLKENSISMETLKHYLTRSILLRQRNTILFDNRLTVALSDYMTIIQKSVKMPFKEFYECQEKLRQIFATQGNFYSDFTQADSLTYLI